MIRTLASKIGQYKRETILTPVFTGLEVLLEVLIPFIIAFVIDSVEAGDLRGVYINGVIMLTLAMLSLICGALAGKYAAAASSGFAANLRDAM